VSEVSWEEFDGGLRESHSKHEMEYTPSVFDAREVLRWEVGEGKVEGWRGVGMCGEFFFSCLFLFLGGALRKKWRGVESSLTNCNSV